MAEQIETRLPHLPLGQAPFEEVYAALENFKPSPIFGGHLRADLPNFFKAGEYYFGARISKDHHIEQSFSPTEYPYIKTSLAYLALLTAGRAFGKDGPDPIPLGQRTERIFEHQSPKKSFVGALNHGLYELLGDYFERYPNLSPALKAVFDSTAGLSGISLALNLEIHDLELALSGQLKPDNISSHLVKRRTFVGFHGFHYDNREDDLAQYEVWCSGQAVAKAISTEAKTAAISIANSPAGKTYDPKQDNWSDNFEGLTSYTKRLVYTAYERFGR